MSLTRPKMLHNMSALSELGSEISWTHGFHQGVRASQDVRLGTRPIAPRPIARYSREPRQLKIVAAKALPKAVGEKVALAREEAEQLTRHAEPLDLRAELNGLSPFVRRNTDVFKRLRAQTTVPMVARGELMGMIFLSEKF